MCLKENLLVKNPKTKIHLKALREKIKFEINRRAAEGLLIEEFKYSIENGLSHHRGKGITIIINHPDIPFEDMIKKFFPEAKIIIVNSRREIGRNIEVTWNIKNGDITNTIFIIDSCIATGSTYEKCFSQIIRERCKGVDRVISFTFIAATQGINKARSTLEDVCHEETIFISGAYDSGLYYSFIEPGFGPNYFTKRAPEKYEAIPPFSEYPLERAQEALLKRLQNSKYKEIEYCRALIMKEVMKYGGQLKGKSWKSFKKEKFRGVEDYYLDTALNSLLEEGSIEYIGKNIIRLTYEGYIMYTYVYKHVFRHMQVNQ
jgi:hypothetical protein